MSSEATTAWDTVTDPANPQPNIWPACPTCDTSYVYRRGLSMSRGWVWYWSKDCKHTPRRDAVLMTVDGPYQSDTGAES